MHRSRNMRTSVTNTAIYSIGDSTMKSLKSLPLREKLNTLYFTIFTPCVNNAIIIFSVLLIGISFVHRSSLSSEWYHLAEGIITLLFALEVVLRLIVMRSSFWESYLNLIEVISCLVCVLVFSVLSLAHNTTRMEHNALIFLRFFAQILRVLGVTKSGSASVVEKSNFSVYSAGGGVAPNLSLSEHHDIV